MAKKRLGYNWKARQHAKKLRKDSARETVSSTHKNEVEDIPERKIEMNTEKWEHKSQKKKKEVERQRKKKASESCRNKA